MGMDTLDLRMRNSNCALSETSCGAEICGCGMTDCMVAVAEDFGWERKKKEKDPSKLRGVGIANMVHTGGGGRFYGFNSAEAIIKLSDEGTVTLITSALDMGQGAHTAMAQIAAEELGVNLADINIMSHDTDLTPYDLGSWGSRASYMDGNAVLAAAKDAKENLVAAAAEMLEVEPGQVVVEEGKIWVEGSDEKHEIAEIVDHAVNAHGEPISGIGRFVDHLPEGYTIPTAFAKNIPCFSFGTQAAEVEVDPETGQIHVLKVVAAHETGTTINPLMAEGQIEGSVVQGIGYALMEQLVHKDGRVINDRFLDYKIPNIGDVPEIKAICVESEGTNGPFGAKGIGEPGLVPTAPAIANAVFDAIGVRFYELPLTRERVLEALKEKRAAEAAEAK
jgi:CO/xanthine dehydrogenase Mo-binding subunit